MAGLLLVADFRARTIMPAADVDYLEQAFPGWLQRRLDEETAYMEARLRKRYVVPLDRTSPPFIALRWLTDIVTQAAFHLRGHNATSEQDDKAINEPADRARAELKEAADSKDGLFDLPTRDAAGGSGVVSGGPLSYSETSPYLGFDLQRQNAEDASGR